MPPPTYIPVAMPAWVLTDDSAERYRLKLWMTERSKRIERERTIVSLDLNAGEA